MRRRAIATRCGGVPRRDRLRPTASLVRRRPNRRVKRSRLGHRSLRCTGTPYPNWRRRKRPAFRSPDSCKFSVSRRMALDLVQSRSLTSGVTMTVVMPQSEQREPRQRDRRQVFGELLSALTRSLNSRSDPCLMRGAFEEYLRRAVPVRSLPLRDATSRWLGRSDSSIGAESIALDVPGADSSSQGVLEATFDPGCRLGEWDFQVLGLAAQVGALVLEIERGRSRISRT